MRTQALAGYKRPQAELYLRFMLLGCKHNISGAYDRAYLPDPEAQRPPLWRWAHPVEHDALRSAVEAATAGQLPPGLSTAGMHC